MQKNARPIFFILTKLELGLCWFNHKLSYAQLFNWGHASIQFTLYRIIAISNTFRSTPKHFQIAYEGNFGCLWIETFWQKVDFLISIMRVRTCDFTVVFFQHVIFCEIIFFLFILFIQNIISMKIYCYNIILWIAFVFLFTSQHSLVIGKNLNFRFGIQAIQTSVSHLNNLIDSSQDFNPIILSL